MKTYYGIDRETRQLCMTNDRDDLAVSFPRVLYLILASI